MDFKFCSFLGLSVPQLILLDLDKNKFKSCMSLLDTPQDSNNLKSFYQEAEIFKRFFEDKLVFDYISPDFRRKSNQIKQSRAFYDSDKTGTPPRKLLKEEELKSLEVILASAPKEIAKYIVIDGKRKDISADAYAIIKYYHEHMYVLEDYINELNITKEENIVIFNRKIEDIQYANPASLKYHFMNKIRTARIGNSKKVEGILRKAIVDIRDSTTILKSKIVSDNTVESSSIPHNIVINSEGTILNVPPMFNSDAYPFFRYLNKVGILANIDLQLLQILVDVYMQCKIIDVTLYNSEFDLNLTANEYEQIFDELDELGLIGLNLYSKEMFFNSLQNISLIKHTQTLIPADCELASVISDLDRITQSLLKQFGEELD